VEELGGEGREGKKGRGRGGGAIQCLASGRHRRSCATGGCVGDLADPGGAVRLWPHPVCQWDFPVHQLVKNITRADMHWAYNVVGKSSA